MTLLSNILIGGLGILGISNIIEKHMFHSNNDILKPVDIVSIIMASYNEEKTIEQSLQSILNQSIVQKYPESFELVLADSYSTDNTVKLAKPYVNRILLTPKGKLTSRRIAISQAYGNIIVSTDSDTLYPPIWLNNLLEPFTRKTEYLTVATAGNTYDYTIPYIPGQIHTMIYTLDRIAVHPNQLPGRNSAFIKKYYYLSGGFDESINQFDIGAMYREEEIIFGNKMAKFGKIVFKNNAGCIHLNGKRIAARLGLYNQVKQQQMIGVDRF